MGMMKELEHMSYEKRLESRDCSAWRRESSEGLTDVCKYLRGWYKEYRAIGAHYQDQWPRHKLKHQGFPLNIKKHFFTVRVTRHCHGLPRVAVEFSSLEIFKRCLDMVLSISRWPCLRSRSGDLLRHLPTPTKLWFHNHVFLMGKSIFFFRNK